MAGLSAAGLEALAAQYYGELTPGARDYTGDYQAAAQAAQGQLTAAQIAYQAAANDAKAKAAAGYAELGGKARSLDALTAAGAGGDSMTAEAMTRNAANGRAGYVGRMADSDVKDAELMDAVTALTGKQTGAEILAENERQRIGAQMSEDQAGAQRELQALSGMIGTRSNVANAQYQQDSLALEQQQQAYSNAMTELDTFGVVMTKAAADALGVPIGTKKAMLSGRGRGGSGGGSGSVEFVSAFGQDGKPIRTSQKYGSTEEAEADISAALNTGDRSTLKYTLQSAVFDRLLSPEEAQQVYDGFNEQHKRYEYGEY